VWFSPLRHSRENFFVRTSYFFQVKDRTLLFVCEKVWSLSCVGLFLGVCLFPVQLIAERSFSLALCAWLKGQKRSAGLYPWRVISHRESGSLLRQLQVNVFSDQGFFFTLHVPVKTTSLELYVDYKLICEHVVCAWDSVISVLCNFIWRCLFFFLLFPCSTWCPYGDAVWADREFMIKDAVLHHP
jgi:hypothetical protein